MATSAERHVSQRSHRGLYGYWALIALVLTGLIVPSLPEVSANTVALGLMAALAALLPLERYRSAGYVQDLTDFAIHDVLTGLANRGQFMEQLARHMFSRAETGRATAVILLDLDRFKTVNDTLGHPAGDKLLIAVASRLEKALPVSAQAFRLGGDEFGVVADVFDGGEAKELAESILKALNFIVTLERQEVWVNVSIGVALAPGGMAIAEDVVGMADVALYQAKDAGRNQVCMFDSLKRRMPTVQALSKESEVRQAAERGQLVLHYQPVLDLSTNRLAGFEALVRWNHPKYGMIKPEDFIPLAEETGAIRDVGHWVLMEACKQAKVWEILFGPGLRTSINLSARQLLQPDFTDQVRQVLKDAEVFAGDVELEITETELVKDTRLAFETLANLKELGVRLAIDDFGVGFSSLNYLRHFEVDTLKIDQSFVRDAIDARTLKIVKAAVDLGHAFSLDVTAEGIESSDQFKYLRSVNCNFGQGFLFSKPLTSASATELLQTGVHILKPGELMAPMHERAA